jgi:hypothetical protein
VIVRPSVDADVVRVLRTVEAELAGFRLVGALVQEGLECSPRPEVSCEYALRFPPARQPCRGHDAFTALVADLDVDAFAPDGSRLTREPDPLELREQDAGMGRPGSRFLDQAPSEEFADLLRNVGVRESSIEVAEVLDREVREAHTSPDDHV